MKAIKFSTKSDAERGYSILLHNGTVVYTSEKDTYIVPDESIKKLGEADLKFKSSPVSKNGRSHKG